MADQDPIVYKPENLNGFYVSGNVFVDANNNRKKDSDEPPKPGVTIKFGSLKKTVTDSDGNYDIAIDNQTGSKTLEIVPPTDYEVTTESSHSIGAALPTLGTEKNFGIRLKPSAAGQKVVAYIGEFRLAGCNGDLRVLRGSDAAFIKPSNIQTPPGTRAENMVFVEDASSGDKLRLPSLQDNVPAGQAEEPLTLDRTPGTFRLLAPHQDPRFLVSSPFFYQDDQRAYSVSRLDRSGQRRLRFAPFFHPHGCAFVQELDREGIPGLLTLDNQTVTNDQSTTVNGMAFTLYGGRATWDRAGTVGADGDEYVWVEDGLPAGAQAKGTNEGWTWVNANPVPFSGKSAHQSNVLAGIHQHYFEGATDTMRVKSGDTLFAYVYLDPANVPSEVMLQWDDGTSWEHRAYWGANQIPWGIDGTESRRYMGPLPKAGEWVRLEVPHGRVGLKATTVFEEEYRPQATVYADYPRENVAFEPGGAYSLYNWELFFHIPLFIAAKLSKDQRFEEAQRWFHYLFDPTNDSPAPSPRRYWRTLPFHENTEEGRIQKLLRALADPAGDQNIKDEMEGRVNEWRDNPFQPHRIARLRLAAYQKTVVMKYIDNLIAWGDRLFSQDTIESINQATQLYVLAHNMLGARPERIPERKLPIDGVWIEDGLPEARLDGNEPWHWVNADPAPFSGTLAHQSGISPDMHQHFFHGATRTLRIQAGDKLFAYVYLDPENVPREVMLQWHDGTSWEHRAYWGANQIPWGIDGTESRRYMGPLPKAGEWVRLEVPAKQVGLEDKEVDKEVRGMAFTLHGGRATWDRAGRRVEPKTYSQIQEKLDSFSNVLVPLENEFPISGNSSSNGSSSGANGGLSLGTTYFCIPQNENLLKYWDTVADRLFKIRHCMNIEGIARQLPLFEPPIDPALLVRAAAAGVDISSALNDISAPLPYYRFGFMLQKALELCAELKSLGGALLAALEKKDAEALSNLRAGHETAVLKAVRLIREQQIEEAMQSLEGLNKSRGVVEQRRNYYRDIMRVSPHEQLHMDSLGTAHVFNELAQGVNVLEAILHLLPENTVGVVGVAPQTNVRFGGRNLGDATRAAAGILSMIAAQYSHDATMASIKAGYDRRWDDWKQQEKLANKELEQIDKQILAAQIRESIAKQELSNHDKQIENAEKVEEFMRDKYTNKELYDWMVSQISAVFFQSYRLAYDVAKRAEKAYRFERGLSRSNFVQFGYWDSLKKGLLSGERLYLDLKRLEMAYLDQNKREYEITKQISLVLHDPLALIALKETGRCHVSLPEELFDMDYPGHYMRRIKSVSLTLPAVTGPYTSINCTLTLLKNKLRIDPRIDPNAEGDYKEKPDEDSRFAYNFGAVQSIALSKGVEDSGMFELNFRDERYLPCEGAGAVSEWRIDLPKECNAFDFDTISDVVIRLNYTAREGGDVLRSKALAAAKLPPRAEQEAASVSGPSLPEQKNLYRMFSAKHEFPNEWHRFLRPQDTANDQRLQLELTPERFPFRFRGRKIEVTGVDVFFPITDRRTVAGSTPPKTYKQAYAEGAALKMFVTPAGGDPEIDEPDPESDEPKKDITLKLNTALDNLAHEMMQYKTAQDLGEWVLKVREKDIPPALQLPSNDSGHKHLNPDAIEDVFVICHYSVSG